VQPVNISVCNSNFIKFHDGAVKFVGLVNNLNSPGWKVIVRKFVTWGQLKNGYHSLEGISFWPHSRKPLSFLCGTDLVTGMGAVNAVSITFLIL
jgi:hypothetical protein